MTKGFLHCIQKRAKTPTEFRMTREAVFCIGLKCLRSENANHLDKRIRTHLLVGRAKQQLNFLAVLGEQMRTGLGTLRLNAKRVRNMAWFKQQYLPEYSRRGLFERHFEQRNSRRHKEQALRYFGRRARFEE